MRASLRKAFETRRRLSGLVLMFGCLLLQAGVTTAAWAQCAAPATTKAPVRLFMPDGQLVSSPLRVFVDIDLPDYPVGKDPVIALLGGRALTTKIEGEQDFRKPFEVVRHQPWTATLGGEKVSLCGTLLLFRIEPATIIDWWKPMRRLTPVLHWYTGEATAPAEAATPRPVNLGNAPAAWALTLLVMISVVGLIGRLGRRKVGTRLVGAPFCLLCADDGHLSLSKVQVAAWTVSIAMVVFFYGLVHLDVPSIPEQLIALMGLSLATGGISYLTPPALSSAPSQPEGLPALLLPSLPVKPGLADLVRNFPSDKPPELSLARAQMIVWTVIVLILFIAKSALDGAFWPVPWELVALTGMSQAGYLAPKFKQ